MKVNGVFCALCASAIVLAASCVWAQDSAKSEIVYKPLVISSGWELGQIVDGEAESSEKDTKGYVLNRLGVWLTQETTVGERLTFKMGAGGIFFYAYPDVGDRTLLVTKVGPGISQATGIYEIGASPDSPLFELQFGYFPFKYNPDAKDLGEYLLRSSPYPGILRGPGWNYVNDALYRALGLRFSNYLFDKSFTQHFLANMERDLYPNHDISLSYIAKYSHNDLFTIGAGISYYHLISWNEDKTTPENFKNRYLGDSAINDTRGINQFASPPIDSLAGQVGYYTFRGIKTMACASLNIRSLLKTDLLGKEDLKLYGELAILGLKDYPFYYDDISKRIPIMIGFNIPAFKILDVLSLELEWYGSQFAQSTENIWSYQTPIWYVNGGDPGNMDDSTKYGGPAEYKTYRELYSHDNWKWAIYAKKRVGKYFSFYLQMANDHMRPKHFDLMDDKIEVTHGNKDWFDLFQNHWYYVFRLDFGI
jgi:hypothetical protein